MESEVNTSARRTTGSAAPGDARLFLRDEELDNGVGLVLASERALVRASETTRRAAGLSRPELQVLLAIRYQPGLDVSTLRQRLSATVPTLARLLAKLDQRGLVERDAKGEDRRRRQLRLSAAGETLTDPIAAAMRAKLRAAFREAGMEQVAGARTLLDVLGR